MSRSIARVLTLAIFCCGLASQQAAAGFAQLIRRSFPEQYTLLPHGGDTDCGPADLRYCFPKVLDETLKSAGESAPAAEILAAALRRMRGGALEMQWGGSSPSLSATPPEIGADLLNSDQRRVALLVGVSDYEHLPKLPGGLENLRLMRETLKGVGFETQELRDPSLVELQRAAHAFAAEAGKADAGELLTLVYLYGVGFSQADQRYFCPRDATWPKPDQSFHECLSIKEFMLGELAPSILVIESDFSPLRATQER